MTPGSPPTAVALPGGTDTVTTHVTLCPRPPRALAPCRNTLLEVQPPQGVDERGLAHVGHADHQDVVLSALQARETRARSSCLPTPHPCSNRQLPREISQCLPALLAHVGAALFLGWRGGVTLPLLCTGGSFGAPQYKREVKLSESVQRMDTRMGKGLEGHRGAA